MGIARCGINISTSLLVKRLIHRRAAKIDYIHARNIRKKTGKFSVAIKSQG
jgi:hypothetical protein